jgi:serine phosphatase RsbU (regulator of sigma subunit)
MSGITPASILAVDDTPANLSLLANLLRDDYRVRVASSGQKALELAFSAPPDLILLDVMMPEMDGHEVIRRLKADPRTMRVPVIFLTAQNSIEDEEFGLSLGAVDFIHKPISPTIVLARIKAQLQSKSWQDFLQNENVWLQQEVERRLREIAEQRFALEYIRKELDIARQLQTGMLPLYRPMFPGRQDIEIAAIMEPATEVGGDLFDAFFVDSGHLFFCIGDVSGHGIAAALFMARTIGLIRIAAMGTDRPDRLIEQINDRLCAGDDRLRTGVASDNGVFMYVTLFCGFLDVSTGHLVYSNGGHCPPLLLRGGEATELPLPAGTLVGVIPGMSYSTGEIVLEEGEALLCYTDGVTEAETVAGNYFSKERLMAVAQRKAGSLEALLDAARGEVADFTGRHPLKDDFTLLAVRRPRICADERTHLRSKHD